MPPYRALRPSIHELKSFLLSPNTHMYTQSKSLRCISLLTKTRTLPSNRQFSTSTPFSASSKLSRPPIPENENGHADFTSLDILGNTPAPSTSIDACLSDGFHLDNGIKITDGDAVLLVAGEAFTWRPWETIPGAGRGMDGYKSLVNAKGQLEIPDVAWGLFGVVWPKPDLLVLGMGEKLMPLSPKTKRYINSLGIRVDVSDTRNAASMFNLLATERGVSSVAGALIPIGL